jgi:hypothetical protein
MTVSKVKMRLAECVAYITGMRNAYNTAQKSSSEDPGRDGRILLKLIL